MNCPFCHNKLEEKRGEFTFYYRFMCRNNNCCLDDMTRYNLKVQNDEQKHHLSLILGDDLYIQIYYDKNKTTIHKLIGSILTNKITLNKIIEPDFENLNKTIDKFKTLLLFS